MKKYCFLFNSGHIFKTKQKVLWNDDKYVDVNAPDANIDVYIFDGVLQMNEVKDIQIPSRCISWVESVNTVVEDDDDNDFDFGFRMLRKYQ